MPELFFQLGQRGVIKNGRAEKSDRQGQCKQGNIVATGLHVVFQTGMFGAEARQDGLATPVRWGRTKNQRRYERY
jgi:hypothetical protein